MNIAVILAGGKDPEFQMSIPKQFVSVNNKPIIVYTMQRFQEHRDIDEIMVICLEGWQEFVWSYAKQFNISKLKSVIIGGDSGQKSIHNGLEHLVKECDSEDIIVLHDAIRPLVTEDIISQSISVCKKKSMGIAAVSVRDTIMYTLDGNTGDKNIPRSEIVRIQTPQSFKLGRAWNISCAAIEAGIADEWEMSSIVTKLGEKVCFSKGADANIKVSNVEDIETFKALSAIDSN